jgi:hypothetical protein
VYKIVKRDKIGCDLVPMSACNFFYLHIAVVCMIVADLILEVYDRHLNNLECVSIFKQFLNIASFDNAICRQAHFGLFTLEAKPS